ncbi:MAG: 2-amino-4-hydroxy-6-hydroxymethyldihydropteridine diphosphokinase [Rikenellaceae bacterium]|jgi:2-amino-4-hydroxy-6-hydroxymethyldihydropteridine diphosphokinase|nr:2-amino-4-hydroxy-6-hydroxymethyldihydropteridine diphosphokinase [Rikenellaceae bacterium]
MSLAVLLTGGNLGCREENIRRAAELIGSEIGHIKACSPVMESVPWGFEAEEQFLNQAIVVETALAPEELLDATQAIERTLGRTQKTSGGYASRTMDIDILYYDELQLSTPRLTVPHPRIAERAFVLRPLAAVGPDRRDPHTGLTVKQMLDNLEAD